MAERIKLPSILQSLAAPGAHAGDVQTAKDQMAIQLAPQEMSIHSTINTIQDFLGRDIQAQQQYGQIADQKIAQVGEQLAGQLQNNVGAIGNIYQAGTQQVGNIYDQGIQATQAAGSTLRDRLSQGANALGQEHALKADPYGNDPISRLLAQQAGAETRLNTSKAGSQANLAQLGTTLQSIAQKAVGDSQREYAQKRTDVQTDVLKSISNLRINGQQAIMEQLDKYSVLAEVAGPTFRTLIGQAASARSNAERQAIKDQLDTMSTLASIEKMRREEDPNSVDNQIKQATLAEKLQGLEDQPLKYLSETEGNANLMSFLNGIVRANRQDTTSGKISGTQHAGIQNFINQNLPATALSGVNNTTDPATILANLARGSIDPKTGLVKLPVTPGSKYKQQDYMVDLPTLLAALTARFQNVGPASKIGTKI
jgi:hypothetical protein